MGDIVYLMQNRPQEPNAEQTLSDDQMILLRVIRQLIEQQTVRSTDEADGRWWQISTSELALCAPMGSYAAEPSLVAWLMRTLERARVIKLRPQQNVQIGRFSVQVTELGRAMRRSCLFPR